MNERIKELAEQAGYKHPSAVGICEDYAYFSLETFAELIVRECCDWIDGSPSTDAGQLLLTKQFIIANLKEHFGGENGRSN